MKHDTSWGKVADWYDEYLHDEDSYQKNVVLPNLMRMLSPRPGQLIADIACGQGYFSEAIIEKEARVVGVDISRELIQKAQYRFEQKKVDGKNGAYASKNAAFHVSGADKLDMIQSSTVDDAICILAAQNIKEIDTMFSEIARILKKPRKLDTVKQAILKHNDPSENKTHKYSRLIMVINHPSFRVPQESDWHFEDKSTSPHKNKQGRVVYRYLSEDTIKIDMNPGIPNSKENARLKKFTVSYHRPLQVFIKLMAKHGFAITRIEEWSSHKKSQEGPRANAENEARKEIPLFMAIEASLIK